MAKLRALGFSGLVATVAFGTHFYLSKLEREAEGRSEESQVKAKASRMGHLDKARRETLGAADSSPAAAPAQALMAGPVKNSDVSAELKGWAEVFVEATLRGRDIESEFSAWARILGKSELRALEVIALDSSALPEQRLVAAYAISRNPSPEATSVALAVSSAPWVRLLPSKGPNTEVRVRALALEGLSTSSLDAESRARLVQVAASSPSRLLRHQAAAQLAGTPEAGAQALRSLVGRGREPSEAQRSLEKLLRHQDVPALKAAARDALIKEYGIRVASFSEGDLKRLMNGLVFLGSLRFRPHPKGLVNSEYPTYVRERIAGISYKPVGSTAETAAATLVDTRNSPTEFRKSEMEVYAHGLQQELMDFVSTIVHEARHVEGYKHRDCVRDERKSACDSNFAEKGSWAAQLEFAARVALYAENVSAFHRANARLLALDLAFEGFNVPALTPALGVAVESKGTLFVIEDGRSRRLGNLGTSRIMVPNAFALTLLSRNGAPADMGWIDPGAELLETRLLAPVVQGGKWGAMLTAEVKDNLPTFGKVVDADGLRFGSRALRAICEARSCSFQSIDNEALFTSTFTLNLAFNVRSVRLRSEAGKFKAEIDYAGQQNVFTLAEGLFVSGQKPEFSWVDGAVTNGGERQRFLGSTEVTLKGGSWKLAHPNLPLDPAAVAALKALEDFRNSADDLQTYEAWNLLKISEAD